MFEAYTVLGALALATASARLFSLVSPVTLRSPGLLAKAVTTLDVISGGRAVLGVGAGWDVAEHEAYGIDFPGSRAVQTGLTRSWPSAAPCSARSRRTSAGSSTRCATPTIRRTRCAAPSPCSWPAAARSARSTWSRGTGTRARVRWAPADVRHKFDRARRALRAHRKGPGGDHQDGVRVRHLRPRRARGVGAVAGRRGRGRHDHRRPGRPRPAIGPTGQVLAEAFPG